MMIIFVSVVVVVYFVIVSMIGLSEKNPSRKHCIEIIAEFVLVCFWYPLDPMCMCVCVCMYIEGVDGCARLV